MGRGGSGQHARLLLWQSSGSFHLFLVPWKLISSPREHISFAGLLVINEVLSLKEKLKSKRVFQFYYSKTSFNNINNNNNNIKPTLLYNLIGLFGSEIFPSPSSLDKNFEEMKRFKSVLKLLKPLAARYFVIQNWANKFLNL